MNNFDFDFLDKKEVNIKLLIVFFLVISVSIYIGFLIYGNRGLNRLIELQENKTLIHKAVNNLKKENVKLQKEYFGLKDIEDSK